MTPRYDERRAADRGRPASTQTGESLCVSGYRPSVHLARWTLPLLVLLVGCERSAPAPVAAPAAVSIAPAAPEPPAAAPEPPATAAAASAAEPDPNCLPRRPKRTGRWPDKQQTAKDLLKGQSLQVFLDARHAGVVVPGYLSKTPDLMLLVGYAMAVPIPDLKVDASGFSGTLSFKQQPFFVKVPWSAVYALGGTEDHKGWVWDDDVPEEAWCR